MEKRYSSVNTEDKLLIEGCRNNDRKSQELLYQKYARGMLHICLSYAKQKDDAKDILQDSFIKVFRNIENFKDTGSLEGWIRRIVSNTAIDFYRSNRKSDFLFPMEHAQNIPVSNNNDSEIKLDTEEIFLTMRKLPDGARIIFQLFAVEGYSHKEIAEKLDISESTSKSQYQRARKIMMELMDKREAS